METALPLESPPRDPRGRSLVYGLLDLFVVLACSLAFAIVISPGRHMAAQRPPVGLLAQELDTTPEQLEQAVETVIPRLRGGPPTEAQKRQVAAMLNVSVERLDTVMDKYRPRRRGR